MRTKCWHSSTPYQMSSPLTQSQNEHCINTSFCVNKSTGKGSLSRGSVQAIPSNNGANSNESICRILPNMSSERFSPRGHGTSIQVPGSIYVDYQDILTHWQINSIKLQLVRFGTRKYVTSESFISQNSSYR